MKKKILMSIFMVFLSLTMVGGIFLAGDNVIPASTPAEVEQEENDEKSSAKYYGPSTSETWMDYAKKTWSTTYKLSGGGTADDPFLIKNHDDFINNFYRKVSEPGMEWYTSVNGESTRARDCHYKLMCDIDLSTRYWTPIGSHNKPFLGSFDGNGHAITGMYIGSSNIAAEEWAYDIYRTWDWGWLGSGKEYLRTDYYRHAYAGLFGKVGDADHTAVIIQNFSLSGDIWLTIDISKKMVENYYYVGGVLGHAHGGTVYNVNSNVAIDVYTSGTSNVKAYIGGVVGQCWEVKNCTNHGTISLTGSTETRHGDWELGGYIPPNCEVFVGGITGNAYCVYNCINYETIGSDCVPATVGGIAGQQVSGWNFDSCINFGDIIYEAYEPSNLDRMERYMSNVGGIVGYVSNSSEVQNCVNYGAVLGYGCASTGYYYSGGFGFYDDLGWGGIVGRLDTYGSFVNKCINYGEVSAGPVSVSGIVGYTYYKSIFNCVNMGSISGSSYNYFFSTKYTHGQIQGGYCSEVEYENCYSAYTDGGFNGKTKTKEELNSFDFYNTSSNWTASWSDGHQFNGSFYGKVAENYGSQWSLSPLAYLTLQDLYNFTYWDIDYGYSMVPTAVIKVLNVEVGYKDKEGKFVEFSNAEYEDVISPYQIEYAGYQKYINQAQTRQYYYLGGDSFTGDGGHHNAKKYYPVLSVQSIDNYGIYFEYTDDSFQIGKGTGTSFVADEDEELFVDCEDTYATFGLNWNVMARRFETVRVTVGLKQIAVEDLTVKFVNGSGGLSNPSKSEEITATDLENKGCKYEGYGGAVEFYGYFTYLADKDPKEYNKIKVKANPNFGYYFKGLSSSDDEYTYSYSCDVFKYVKKSVGEDGETIYGDQIYGVMNEAESFDDPKEMEDLNVYIYFDKIYYTGWLYYMETDIPKELRAENKIPILNLLFPDLARSVGLTIDDDSVSVYYRNESGEYSDGLTLGYYYDVYLFPVKDNSGSIINITRNADGKVVYNGNELTATLTGLELDRYKDDTGDYYYDLSFDLQNGQIFSDNVNDLYDFGAIENPYRISSKQETEFKIYLVRSNPIEYTINLHDLSNIYTNADNTTDPDSYFEFNASYDTPSPTDTPTDTTTKLFKKKTTYGGSTSFNEEVLATTTGLNIEGTSGDTQFTIYYNNRGKHLNDIFSSNTYFSVGHDGSGSFDSKYGLSGKSVEGISHAYTFTLRTIVEKYFEEVKDSGHVIDLYTYFKLNGYKLSDSDSGLLTIESTDGKTDSLKDDMVVYRKSRNDGTGGFETGNAKGNLKSVYYLEPIELTAKDYEDDDAYAGHKFVGYYTNDRLLSTNKKYIIYSGEYPHSSIVAKYTTFSTAGVAPELVDYNGTKTYNVSTPEHLIWLSNQVESGNTFENITIRQQCDIDMKDTVLLPIGSNTTPFKGTYDGNGYLIENLALVGENLALVGGNLALFSEMGLFGVTENATIQDLTLVGGKVYGYSNVGAFVGKAINTKFEKVNNFSCEVSANSVSFYDFYKSTKSGAAYNTEKYYDSYTDAYYDSTAKAYVDIDFESEEFGSQTNYAGIVGYSKNNTYYMASNRVDLDFGDENSNVGGVVGLDDGNSTFELSFSENEKFGNGVAETKLINSYYIYEYKYKKDDSHLEDTEGKAICYYMQDSADGYFVYSYKQENGPGGETTEKSYAHYYSDGTKESLNASNVKYDPAIWMQLYGKYVLKCYYWH